MPRVLAALERDQIVVSVGGETIEDYVALCRETEARFGGRIAALELNAACPNVSHGAGFYSRDPQAARELVQAVREAVVLPVFLKFNTNFPNYLEVAAAVEAAGADALYTTNTPLGMKIDLHRRRPALGNGRGPICGPAIRPIGVLRTWELYEAVRLPIIASGGISAPGRTQWNTSWRTCAVGVGSAQFVQPDAASDILSGLERYAAAEGLECLTPLVGAAHPDGVSVFDLPDSIPPFPSIGARKLRPFRRRTCRSAPSPGAGTTIARVIERFSRQRTHCGKRDSSPDKQNAGPIRLTP